MAHCVPQGNHDKFYLTEISTCFVHWESDESSVLYHSFFFLSLEELCWDFPDKHF